MNRGTQPLRVLVVATWYPTEHDPAAGIFVQDQVRVLARKYDVTVVAPDLRTIRTIAAHGLGPRMRLSHEPFGVMVARPRVISPVPGRPALVVESWRRAVRDGLAALRGTGGLPDLIHAHVILNGGYAAAHLGNELGIPVVLTEHATETSSWLRTSGRQHLISDTLRAIPIHVAVSPVLAARIRRIAAVDVRVVGNIVDSSFFVPRGELAPAAHNEMRFASVGGLVNRKGIDVLLRAGKHLRDRGFTGWIVRIAGDGPERQPLERMTKRLGLESNIQFVGLLGREAIRDLLEWADSGVFPSRSETFGLAAAEAMAMGRPVIGTHNGGFDFVVEPGTGLLVPVDDPEALADAMEDVITGRRQFDPAIVRESIVRRFGPEAFLGAISAVYQDALALRKSSA